MLTHCSLLVFAFAALLPAQTTHVVQGGGAALQAAINAAAPGDILDVMPGSYSSITVTRGLRISMRPGASLAGTWAMPAVPAVTITTLPAQEAVVIEGGSFDSIHAIDCLGAVVCNRTDHLPVILFNSSRIERCTGPVLWQQVVQPWGPGFAPIHVVDSTQVSFKSCDLEELVVTNSRVSLADTRIPANGGARPAIDVVSGTVVIAGGHCVGGQLHGFMFAPGIRLVQGDLVLAGGAQVESSFPVISNLPAIATTGGTVRIDPSVVFVGTAPVGGPAVVTNAYTPSLAVAHNPGSANYQLTLAAEPNSLAFTLLGLPVPVQPSPWGDLWLVPQSLILDIATVPANGSYSFTRSLTGLPPLLGLVAQSATLSPTNTIAVSVPIRFVWD